MGTQALVASAARGPGGPRGGGGGRQSAQRRPAVWGGARAPPRLQAPRLRPFPSPGPKNLQPHLRPIVLAGNLGQGHCGGEGTFPPLLPWKSRDRSPGRSPGKQPAPLSLVQGQREQERRTSRPAGSCGGGRGGVRGPAGRTAAALITLTPQVPISSEEDSRDAAFNNYQ